MHVTVAGKQVETGEALKTHVSDGLAILTGKYFDHAIEASVTFSRDRAFFGCDINLKAGRGLSVRAEGEGTDAHRAFDIAAEHLAKRLRRYRRRVNEHARSSADRERPQAARQVILHHEAHVDGEEMEEPELHGESAAIVAEQPAEIAFLSVGEAVMRLDLEQAPLMMFRNQKTRELNVIYRRPDGHIGWIDPAGR
ncbi:SSU ribosomal protein S30P /sigma 54 modulation protein [Humitalea rosea]|uniref:Ribosome hibernation promoting factor n=1 Tax=Humitalea rosea TaxID=990373 RepID=A0A2W7IBS6_9PROT|nr:ribosome-associated translation inhibitor RaiA [Humitalea rosea]PZW43548.1 SSU ribosomal protein S30P /sigma 54 modulation protein [Humitalea rosea]